MNKIEIQCPYCHYPNVVGENDFDLLVGDGDCGEIKSEGAKEFVETICENCDNEFNIEVYIPQYVYAELIDKIDYDTWFELRNIKKPIVKYYNDSDYNYVVRKIINSEKFPKELYNKKYRGSIDDKIWKNFVKQCWEKRDRIVYDEQE